MMPVITISRQYGSGGSEVARILARLLGWDLMDNAVIDAVAARTGLTPSEVADREERLPSLAERLVEALMMGTEELISPIANTALPPSDERLLEVTHKIIDEAAARGAVVIVGRGAQETLHSRPNMLSVFCYAPLKALVARCMDRDNLNEADATRRVEETNKRRSEWVRAHWNREWGNPANYDICVNTGTFGVNKAAEIIYRAARDRFSGDSSAETTGASI